MKYSMYICSCGRVHMIPNEKIEEAIVQEKVLVYICGGCGAIRIIGADESVDGYSMFSYRINYDYDNPISLEDIFVREKCKPYTEILYSPGIRVPMKTGMCARSYNSDHFCDTWHPDWSKIEWRGITTKKFLEFINKYKRDQVTVDMDRFIRETPDEYLDDISKYCITAFDWNGTRWDWR